MTRVTCLMVNADQPTQTWQRLCHFHRSTIMKQFATTVFVLLILVAARPSAAITNGDVDEHNLFPEVGAFLLIHPPSDQPDLPVPRIFGSGTLIGPSLVLTSGHVTEAIEFNISIGRLRPDDF